MASTLWRRRWLIIGVVIITSLIGAAVLTSLTPRYRSHAVIALDRASNHSATFDTPLTSLVVDGEAVASEIELIYSRELIEQVVVDQQLLDTKEYGRKDEAGQPGFPAQMLAGVRAQIKAAIQDLLPTTRRRDHGNGNGNGNGNGHGRWRWRWRWHTRSDRQRCRSIQRQPRHPAQGHLARHRHQLQCRRSEPCGQRRQCTGLPLYRRPATAAA